MRRRNKRSTAAKRRNSRKNQEARPNTTRRRPEQARSVLARRTTGRLSDSLIRGRRTEGPRKITDRVLDRHRDRRAPLRPQLETSRQKRLSGSSMPVRRDNAYASARQTRQSLCTRKKAARRAVIIATGHGGINNVRNYRRQSKCR